MVETNALRAVNSLVAVIPPEIVERVPLKRIVQPLDTKTKLTIATGKWWMGALLGAFSSLTIALQSGQVSNIWALLATVGMGALAGALGLPIIKFARETAKDKRLEGIRETLTALDVTNERFYIELASQVMTAIVLVMNTLGVSAADALQKVGSNMAATSTLPQEVAEFLLAVSQVLEPAGPGGVILTPDEVQEILSHARSVKEATKIVIDTWRGKEA